MKRNILQYLEESEARASGKVAYFSENISMTYGDMLRTSKAIGTKLSKKLGEQLKPIMVYMDKSPLCLAAFWGCVYSRNFYVPCDTGMPEYRISLIVENLKPAAVITDMAHYDEARKFSSQVFLYEEMVETEIDEDIILNNRMASLDTDPVYVLYTSGSTGVPKGVVVCHVSLIDYIEDFCNEIPLTSDDVIANQAPFYFDASLIDIYCTLKLSATMGIVPLEYFSMPIKLLEYLENNKITAIRWVPSAMKMVFTFKGFKSLKPQYLKTVIFGAESMPTKCYNYWKANYPDVTFIQIYGPTEITGVCTYYIIDQEYADDETIPIGNAFFNTEVFLLDDEDNLITRPNVTGEICIKGSCLALGYYNSPEKTAEVFTQNPLNPYYPERIYRTGDLAKYNEKKQLVFISRKDSQIKHMGHRIELGEIETAVASMPGIKDVCCLYNQEKQKIVLFYESESLEVEKLSEELKGRLVRYMIPNVLKKMDSLPHMKSGKVDRQELKKLL